MDSGFNEPDGSIGGFPSGNWVGNESLTPLRCARRLTPSGAVTDDGMLGGCNGARLNADAKNELAGVSAGLRFATSVIDPPDTARRCRGSTYMGSVKAAEDGPRGLVSH